MKTIDIEYIRRVYKSLNEYVGKRKINKELLCHLGFNSLPKPLNGMNRTQKLVFLILLRARNNFPFILHIDSSKYYMYSYKTKFFVTTSKILASKL